MVYKYFIIFTIVKFCYFYAIIRHAILPLAMRNIYFLICFFLTAGTIGSFSSFFDINFAGSTAGGTTYAVEIAKFKYPVYTDYFEEIEGVVELSGENGEYHYLSGLTSNKGDAEKLVETVKSYGYVDAKVLDLHTTFSSEQIASVLSEEKDDQDQTKKKKITKQSVQKNKAAEVAIGKLNNIGTEYFYTIVLQQSKDVLNAESFAPHNAVKVFQNKGKYHYVLGRFEDVGDAQKYLKNEVLSGFPNANLAVVNKGELVEYRAKKEIAAPKKLIAEKGSYNMGRKMRGKEYVDYYYELGSLEISKKPYYTIEIGNYNDKKLADEAVQKLRDLGFSQAKIKTPSTKNSTTSNSKLTKNAKFAIQVLASKSEMSVKRINFKDLTRTFDKQDELYRYFYGSYDNYWVCRRQLREVREKGYADAFIVRL